MSIADKLATIAENEHKVYQAGEQKKAKEIETRDAEIIEAFNSELWEYDVGGSVSRLEDAPLEIKRAVYAGKWTANQERDALDEERRTAINAALTANGATAADTLDNVDEKIPEVHAAGVQSEYDRFWDVYQTNGTKTAYNYSFYGTGWTNETFKPKYSLNIVNGNSTFYNSRISDFSWLEENGVDIITENCTNPMYMFCGSTFRRLPTLSVKGNLQSMFSSCAYLETIEKMVMLDACSFKSAFSNAKALKNIEIEGTIAIQTTSSDKTFNISWSPLSVKSMKSIIMALKDCAGTSEEFVYTVNFSSSCWAALDAEGNTSPNGNTWKHYVEDKGWNA